MSDWFDQDMPGQDDGYERYYYPERFEEENKKDMIIYVDTEEQKQDLLKQSKYIHDFMEVVRYKKDGKVKEKWIGLDSDKAGSLMHLYMAPDIIVVR